MAINKNGRENKQATVKYQGVRLSRRKRKGVFR